MMRIIRLFILIHVIDAQKYVIQRDFPTSYQFNSFVVLTPDERQILYRIETQYSFVYLGTIKYFIPLNDLIIVANIDAFLGSDRIFNFRILNSVTGRWLNGRIIQQNLRIFVIELSNYQQIIIESNGPRTPEMSSLLTVRFRDGRINSKVYAEYIQRGPWISTYDLFLYTNEYPLELFLTGFAIVQRRN